LLNLLCLHKTLQDAKVHVGRVQELGEGTRNEDNRRTEARKEGEKGPHSDDSHEIYSTQAAPEAGLAWDPSPPAGKIEKKKKKKKRRGKSWN